MYPDAEVQAEGFGGSGITVSTDDGEEICSMRQRELFSKYGHPGKDTIVAALQKHKAANA